MEHYSKGKNVEEELTRDKIPIPDLPKEFTWMKVRGGSKIRNLVAFANKSFKEEGVIVWTGSGPASSKAISCAEIMKRTFSVHQITKNCTQKIEEFWDPKIEGLDPLVVIRTIPVVHILLSKEPLNKNEPGYLPPGSMVKKTPRKAPIEILKVPKLSPAEFAELGLRSNANRRPKPVKNVEKPRPKIPNASTNGKKGPEPRPKISTNVSSSTDSKDRIEQS